jgi:hypothetical protein
VSLTDALLGLWPAVDKAAKLARAGNAYTQKDPNFYSNWLAHLHQELGMLRKVYDRKGAEKAQQYASKFRQGSGGNPDRPGHKYGARYLDWVADLSNDRGFPGRFKKAVAMTSKLAEEINDLMEASEFSNAKEAGRRLFQRVRPKKTRAATLKAIASAITKDTILMDIFSDMAVKYRASGGVSYHNVADVLGDTIAMWKDRNEMDEDEFDSLSTDPFLAKAINLAVLTHKIRGGTLPGINWSEVDHLMAMIETKLRRARGGQEERLVGQAKLYINTLLKELSK